MTDDIMIVVCYIAALYDKGLCPENVSNAMSNILFANRLWARLCEIYFFEGGYEKYVNEHPSKL